MTISTYIPLALKIESTVPVKIECPSLAPYNPNRLVHAALGLSTECLEFIEAKSKPSKLHQLNELGDICWFAMLACDELKQIPDDSLQGIPITGIDRILSMCEAFASRIKSALYYGSPNKHGDPIDYWISLPPKILAGTVAIANQHCEPGLDILTMNINKLAARYPDKFSTAAALKRDTALEDETAAAQVRVNELLAKKAAAPERDVTKEWLAKEQRGTRIASGT